MPDDWRTVESDCCMFLNREFGSDYYRFKQVGGSNSNAPDIMVECNGKQLFKMEVKSRNSQAGQFVLHVDSDEHKFIHSELNSPSEPSIYSKKIIDIMNLNFASYVNPGTGGKSIDCDESICLDWILDCYLSRGVMFFITRDNHGQYLIFPTAKLGEYFSAQAFFRVKKSGSSNPAMRDWNSILEVLKKQLPLTSFRKEGKKYFVTTQRTLSNDDAYPTVNGLPYYLSGSRAGYQVRRLGSTRNENVIFKINLKDSAIQHQADLDSFKAALSKTT